MLPVQPIWYGQQCNEQRKKELATVNYLFLISIGPVQDFIASARRSRDLWFGSWLLSELSKAAAHKLAQSYGVNTLIFPTPAAIKDLAPGSMLNVANKIMAVVAAEDADAVQALGEQVEQSIQDRLKDIYTQTYNRIPDRGNFDRTIAEKQMQDLVEYYWAAVPLTDKETYPVVRSRLEALMAARKVTRDVRSMTWGSNRPKSSLDGQRESVIAKDAYKNLSVEQLRKQYGVRPGEHLCGIGLLKRHGVRVVGGEDHRFLSTSHVAALPLLARMTEADKPEVATYIKSLEWLDPDDLGQVPGKPHPAFGRYDGHLLFEERLKEFFESTGTQAQERLSDARQALTYFLKQTVDGQRPIPYYALLHADGDNMGKVIDATDSIEGHRKLSRALSSFADRVREIVEDTYSGALIYAGGDDVLALLPLHTVLKCARELANNFRDTMKEFTAPLDKKKPALGTISPTLSAGIAVCHHIEPLSDALDLARKAEKQAKAVPGKNALAVTVSKRSGVDRTVTGKWQPGEDVATAPAEQWRTLDQRLTQFVRLHRKDEFPDGAAYELHNLYLRVGETLPPEALNVEALRILKRKRAQGGKAKIDEQLLLLQNIEQVLNLTDMTLERFANEIIIARIFADADRQAHPDTDKQAKEQPDAALDH
jgi:CRISPR-associated protein Cmr2